MGRFGRFFWSPKLLLSPSFLPFSLTEIYACIQNEANRRFPIRPFFGSQKYETVYLSYLCSYPFCIWLWVAYNIVWNFHIPGIHIILAAKLCTFKQGMVVSYAVNSVVNTYICFGISLNIRFTVHEKKLTRCHCFWLIAPIMLLPSLF